MRDLVNIKKYSDFINEAETEGYFYIDELPENIQKKAIEQNKKIIVTESDDWAETAINQFKETELVSNGVYDPWVDFYHPAYFKGNSGATFTSSDVDSEEFMKNALGIKSTNFLDMGDADPEDDLSGLLGDLEDVGYERIERLKPGDFEIKFPTIKELTKEPENIDVKILLDDSRKLDKWPEKLQNAATEAFSEWENKANEWAIRKANQLYSVIRNEYDRFTSPDMIKLYLASTSALFDKEGQFVGYETKEIQ